MRSLGLLKLAAGTLLASTLLAASLSLGSPVGDSPPRDRLTVHEWGTFTCLQDEDGRAIPGINTDDELLPDFVHNIGGVSLGAAQEEVPSIYFKAIPRCHPDVYVRLETPVVYFYPPAGGLREPIDVHVSFKGGWLTQYYPQATPGGPDVNEKGELRYGPLTYKADGSLTWRGLRVGGNADGPKTDDKVWLAPRQVPEAASVKTANGERERYLFYRGVGRIDAPLRVVRRSGNQLAIQGQWGNVPSAGAVGPLWLVDARADGKLAFRPIDAVDLSRGGEGHDLAQVSATFSESDYASDNYAKVRGQIHAALLRDGLYPDEATAMLNTWEVSYFKRPGLRLFFMVPRPWTEAYLPMHLSQSADVTRVMVGRIEIVTPEQRATLKRIAAGPVSNADWAQAATERLNAQPRDAYREDWYREVAEGRRSRLEALGIRAPEDYRVYLSLGRFRNALVNDELKRRPSDELQKFISNYNLELAQF
jgi:hypothetical protein